MPNRSFDHPLRRSRGPRTAVAAARVPVPIVWLGVVGLSLALWSGLIALLSVVL
jgi:hypothetical protein